MRRFLLDSNAISALIDRRESLATRSRDARRRGDRIGTCEPVVAELFYGLALSSSRDENRLRLGRALSQITTCPFDRRAAMAYGVAADLRRRGRPMQAIDIMLAAVAMTIDDCVVITTDSDLSAVPGLPVANWMAADPGQAP